MESTNNEWYCEKCGSILKSDYKNLCKKCYKKQYRELNKEKISKHKHEFYLENRIKILNHVKIYASLNKEKVSKTYKKYRQSYKEKFSKYDKEYYKLNKNKIMKYKNKWVMNRRRKNNIFKLMCNIRTLIKQSFKNKGYKKDSKTEQILQKSWIFLFNYINSQLKNGMTWNNYGGTNGWSIDHHIPLAFAKTEEELIKLNSYKNLRPMWLRDNILKSDKLPYDLYYRLIELDWF